MKNPILVCFRHQITFSNSYPLIHIISLRGDQLCKEGLINGPHGNEMINNTVQFQCPSCGRKTETQ